MAAVSNVNNRRTFLIVFAVLVLFLIGVLIWKRISDARWEEEVARQRASLTTQAAESLEKRTAELLRVAAMSFSFASREGLMKRDYQQIRQYLPLLVREKNVAGAAVADQEGRIVAATDQKLETQPGAQLFPPGCLRGDGHRRSAVG